MAATDASGHHLKLRTLNALNQSGVAEAVLFAVLYLVQTSVSFSKPSMPSTVPRLQGDARARPDSGVARVDLGVPFFFFYFQRPSARAVAMAV